MIGQGGTGMADMRGAWCGWPPFRLCMLGKSMSSSELAAQLGVGVAADDCVRDADQLWRGPNTAARWLTGSGHSEAVGDAVARCLAVTSWSSHLPDVNVLWRPEPIASSPPPACA
jgi:hypothetical protein